MSSYNVRTVPGTVPIILYQVPGTGSLLIIKYQVSRMNDEEYNRRWLCCILCWISNLLLLNLIWWQLNLTDKKSVFEERKKRGGSNTYTIKRIGTYRKNEKDSRVSFRSLFSLSRKVNHYVVFAIHSTRRARVSGERGTICTKNTWRIWIAKGVENRPSLLCP